MSYIWRSSCKFDRRKLAGRKLVGSTVSLLEVKLRTNLNSINWELLEKRQHCLQRCVLDTIQNLPRLPEIDISKLSSEAPENGVVWVFFFFDEKLISCWKFAAESLIKFVHFVMNTVLYVLEFGGRQFATPSSFPWCRGHWCTQACIFFNFSFIFFSFLSLFVLLITFSVLIKAEKSTGTVMHLSWSRGSPVTEIT